MDDFFAKVDDNVTALWLETAGLAVFMSLIFFLALIAF